jgi:predicted nucleic acid-binding protein
VHLLGWLAGWLGLLGLRPPERREHSCRRHHGHSSAMHAIDLECAAALRGLVRGQKLPSAEAERALELLGSMRLERYGHAPLHARIWQLRHNMWPYDAAYVALAESLNAELVTLDGKIEGVPGVRCAVRNLRDDT